MGISTPHLGEGVEIPPAKHTDYLVACIDSTDRCTSLELERHQPRPGGDLQDRDTSARAVEGERDRSALARGEYRHRAAHEPTVPEWPGHLDDVVAGDRTAQPQSFAAGAFDVARCDDGARGGAEPGNASS